MAADPVLGRSFGSFVATRHLGRGSIGEVYLAENPSIGSKVALKLLDPHHARDPKALARFRAEARASNLIHHEHVVSVMDFDFEPPDLHYFVMEHLEGRALSELALPLEVPLLVHICAQICEGLEAAHAVGVVNRDLKPENVRLVSRLRDPYFVKVVDFGIAKFLAEDSDPALGTAPGQLVGTPAFMAPEQTTGAQVDGRTDLYALGVMMYELATGVLPFVEPTVAELLAAHRTRKPRPPEQLNPELPGALSRVILRLLEKSPDDRFQSAEAVRQALLGAPTQPAPVLTPVATSKVWPVRVFDSRGQFRKLAGIGLRPESVEIVSQVRPPDGMAMVAALAVGDFELRLPARVSAHTEQGFALTFTGLSPAQLDALSDALEGRPLHDDERTQVAVATWAPLLEGNHYQQVDVPLGAPLAGIVAALASRRQALLSLLARPVRRAHLDVLEAALHHLDEARRVFTSPLTRLAYDASLSNWKGVLQSLEEGVTAEQLAETRSAFMAGRQRSRGVAEVHASAATTWAERGDAARAADELRRALEFDPLNAAYLERQLRGA
jgi:serine/threonine-protein kinase